MARCRLTKLLLFRRTGEFVADDTGIFRIGSAYSCCCRSVITSSLASSRPDCAFYLKHWMRSVVAKPGAFQLFQSGVTPRHAAQRLVCGLPCLLATAARRQQAEHGRKWHQLIRSRHRTQDCDLHENHDRNLGARCELFLLRPSCKNEASLASARSSRLSGDADHPPHAEAVG